MNIPYSAEYTLHSLCAPAVCLMAHDRVPISRSRCRQSCTGKPYLLFSFARRSDEKLCIWLAN